MGKGASSIFLGFGQPSASLKAAGSLHEASLKTGVVLSGRQAPGGEKKNVISGNFGENHQIQYFYLTYMFLRCQLFLRSITF